MMKNTTEDVKGVEATFRPGRLSPVWLIRRRLLQGIKTYAPEFSGRMLDFGCGSKPYKALFEVDEYIGLDYDGEGHDHTNEEIDFFYDGKTIPFDDKSFDCILATEVFEHLFNPDEILKEMHRVLRPGGKLLITCPFAFSEHEQPIDFARYTSFGIKDLVQRNGFKIIRQEKLGNAIEAIWQFRITYWEFYIIKFVRKIPVIRTLARLLVFGGMNTAAQITGSIFPESKDLYLSNLLLVQKS